MQSLHCLPHDYLSTPGQAAITDYASTIESNCATSNDATSKQSQHQFRSLLACIDSTTNENAQKPLSSHKDTEILPQFIDNTPSEKEMKSLMHTSHQQASLTTNQDLKSSTKLRRNFSQTSTPSAQAPGKSAKKTKNRPSVCTFKIIQILRPVHSSLKTLPLRKRRNH